MEPSGELIVNPTPRHFFQSGGEDMSKLLSIACGATGVLARPDIVRVGTGVHARPAERSSALVLINHQINHRSMRKLGRTPETALSLVKHLESRVNNLLNNLWREIPSLSRE